MSNTNLLSAKSKGYDDFYTQLDSIVAEFSHYEKHFVGKVVYCNCDDPDESQFVKFFRDNFKYLGLKSLITSGYKSQESDLFWRHNEDRSWYKFYDVQSGEHVVKWSHFSTPGENNYGTDITWQRHNDLSSQKRDPICIRSGNRL